MQVSGPGSQLGKMSGKSRSWSERFPGLNRDEVFDFATAMFLDCEDEAYIAGVMSEQYGCAFTPALVRNVRVEAAVDADKIDDVERRKKWIYRYQSLTLNNLVKEYMFLTRAPSFFEAKIELADELYWLGQKYSRTKLLIAFNDAVGRNNIPDSLVQELLDFRETMLRTRSLVSDYAEAKGEDLMVAFLEVADRVSKAFMTECRRDSVKTAQFACRLLRVEEGSFVPGDAAFFREYAKCARYPDRSDSNALIHLMEGADTLVGKSPLNEALSGNMPNMSATDIQDLMREMWVGPVLDAKALQMFRQQADDRAGSDDLGRNVFEKFRDMLDGHLALLDPPNFYPPRRLFRVREGLPEKKLGPLLEALNSMSTSEEVITYLRAARTDANDPKKMESFAEIYCQRRFMRSFPRGTQLR